MKLVKTKQKEKKSMLVNVVSQALSGAAGSLFGN